MLAGCIQFFFNLSRPKSVADVNGPSEKHSYSHADMYCKDGPQAEYIVNGLSRTFAQMIIYLRDAETGKEC